MEGTRKENCSTTPSEMGFGAKEAGRSSSQPSCPDIRVLINTGSLNSKPKSLEGAKEDTGVQTRLVKKTNTEEPLREDTQVERY